MIGPRIGPRIGAPIGPFVGRGRGAPEEEEEIGAAPDFVAAGTAVSHSTTTVAPTWPTHEAGDVALLICESSAAEAVTLTDAQGFVEADDSPQASATATLDSRLTVFWCRATGTSMAAPTVADPGNHILAQILTFRGCVDSGDPYNVTAGEALGAEDTAVSVPGGTTTVDNCLVVVICSSGRDLLSTAAFGGWTNADLVDVTEIADVHVNDGNGGGFGAACGVKETAGLFGATTANALGVTTGQGRIMIALKPQT